MPSFVPTKIPSENYQKGIDPHFESYSVESLHEYIFEDFDDFFMHTLIKHRANPRDKKVDVQKGIKWIISKAAFRGVDGLSILQEYKNESGSLYSFFTEDIDSSLKATA